MSDAGYGYTKTLEKTSFEDAEKRVVEALKAEGFGVLTEIDVRATFAKKLEVDFPPYKILGACNPKLAHRALSMEPGIGLLLPCNVVLMQDAEGRSVVKIIKPQAMFQVADTPGLGDLAGEVDAKLVRVMDAL